MQGVIVTAKYTVTISYMGTSSVISIPKPLMEGYGLEKEERSLQVYATDDGIYIPIKAKHTNDKMMKELQKLR